MRAATIIVNRSVRGEHNEPIGGNRVNRKVGLRKRVLDGLNPGSCRNDGLGGSASPVKQETGDRRIHIPHATRVGKVQKGVGSHVVTRCYPNTGVGFHDERGGLQRSKRGRRSGRVRKAHRRHRAHGQPTVTRTKGAQTRRTRLAHHRRGGVIQGGHPVWIEGYCESARIVRARVQNGGSAGSGTPGNTNAGLHNTGATDDSGRHKEATEQPAIGARPRGVNVHTVERGDRPKTGSHGAVRQRRGARVVSKTD